MEGPQRRDINELLANGYFKTSASTSRAKSPSGYASRGQGGTAKADTYSSTPTSANAPSFLRAHDPEPTRARSRSRVPRGPPPPRPIVEDELVSLERESAASPRPSYDPPLRGKIDQNPILLEADVTATEAARLQEIPCPREKNDRDDSGERRFVLVPKSDTYEPNDKDEIINRKEEIRNHKAAKHDAPRQEQRREPLRRSPVRQKPSKESLRRESPKREERRDTRPVIPEPRREERKETRPPQEQPRREERRDERRDPRPVIHQDTRRKEEEPRRRVERADSGISSRPIVHQEPQRKEERREPERPPIARRRSRQDLPTLETKVPREIPPQFRRSASAFAALPKDKDETPKASTPRGSAGADYFLSPETFRSTKETSSSAAPRQQVHDLLWGKTGTPVTEKRNSGSLSRPGTPNSEKRNSGNFDSARNEKLTRSQQLSEEFNTRNSDRHPSSDHSGRSSRSSRGYYSSSEDDVAPESDVEKHRKKHHRRHRDEHSHLSSPSRANGRNLELRQGSRLNSPLPSPKVSPSQISRGDEFERRETFPLTRDRRPSSRPVSPHSADKETPRADLLNPFDASTRPKSRPSSAAPAPKPPAHHTSVPIPIPTRIDLSSTDLRRSVPQFDEHRPNGPRPQPQPASWQPPPFSPPSQNLDKPVGSYRRYSEDIERGSIAPLPTCPRTTFSRGRNDWLTLPQCPSFDICPSCFNSTIAPTEYRDLFVPAPRRSPDTEVLCDFGSSPWYRIAWLLTVKERRRDLKLFYGLANIAATIQPCLGKHEAIRSWHSIVDPKTGGLVRGFDVCYSCVKSVETLLPSIRGVFVRSESQHSTGSPRICDLRFDSKRFVQYFDALETAADQADYDDGAPDTRNLAGLAKHLALFDECRQDTDIFDKRWHIITQLPEFTVCEECFDEVVWPELEEGKAIPMMFNKTLQRIPKASCQLYSPKMRGIFRLASDSGDYKMLASKARERKTIELVHKKDMAELRRRKGDPGVEREMIRLEEDWRRWE
ncbi:related to ser/arg-related nuclear matrix protein [Phialocephala subalpina]|uniref:Related to ser/arg-related nuclear matrix protein n=1 Tax=Phialocephala subalpina TaxID=576137 RepID=A0A1L7X5N6_9HELO|nr:related to ser/arg-related nuclear matrix protein [Phialocephala subalpina]